MTIKLRGGAVVAQSPVDVVFRDKITLLTWLSEKQEPMLTDEKYY